MALFESFFFFYSTTTIVLKVLDGDSSTVNCVQGHPSAPLLASSGIDAVVRLWDPRPEDGTEEPRLVKVG